MIFLSDYSLHSKDILQFCYFSYREAGGLTHMCPRSSTIFKKKFLDSKKFTKKILNEKKIKKF